MFAKDSLVQFLAGTACFSVIQAIVLVSLGAVLIGNEQYHQLLGSGIRHVGGGLVLTGLLFLLLAALSYVSAHTCNKFLLLLQATLLVVLIFLQTLLGGVALGRAVSRYDMDAKAACLAAGGYATLSVEDQRACTAYTRSDEFVGATLVWMDLYARSARDADVDARARLLDLQRNHFCCGLGAPTRCVHDDRAFPAGFPSTDLSAERRQRVVCLEASYPGTGDCGGVSGRCVYDLPVGACGANPVVASTRGCAAFVFQELSVPVQAIGATALTLALFPLSALLASLCLCFKRRDHDVRPDVDFLRQVQVHCSG